ncbi:MAG: HAD family hydrolase [Deltaproteobacteria bacterium]|nr:HAD family hydrolase [Deltaproteobacteria bacterium]
MTLEWIIFDVDDVVLDMDQLSQVAERAVQDALTEPLGADAAARVYQGLHAAYDTLRAELRATAGGASEAHRRLIARFEGWQQASLQAGHELKQWSRQSLLSVALEDAGLPARPEWVELGARAYWAAVAEGTRILPDAQRAVAAARAAGLGVHFATNSDGGLTFDPASGTYGYDAAEATRQKVARLDALLALGFTRADVTVGDPIGKPHRAFYEAVLTDVAAKAGAPVDPGRVAAVGDSLTNDVLPLMRMGAERGAWILRKSEGPTPAEVPEAPRVWRIRSLDELGRLGFFG